MNLITREELRAKLDRGEELRLVMTLSVNAYLAKRIPSSLHFETIEEALEALDRGDEIVVYCANVACAASIRAYYLLERAGYTRVRRYSGGIADWEDAAYPLDHGAPDTTTASRSRAAKRPRGSARRYWQGCP